MAQQHIGDLPAEAREAEIFEESVKIRTFERARKDLMARDSRLSGKFSCDYPGCLAKPFDSQNLLRYGLSQIDRQDYIEI